MIKYLCSDCHGFGQALNSAAGCHQPCEGCSGELEIPFPGEAFQGQKCTNCGHFDDAAEIDACPACGENTWVNACERHSVLIENGLCDECIDEHNQEVGRLEEALRYQATLDAAKAQAFDATQKADFERAISILSAIKPGMVTDELRQMLTEIVTLCRLRLSSFDALRRGIEEDSADSALIEVGEYKKLLSSRGILDQEFFSLVEEVENLFVVRYRCPACEAFQSSTLREIGRLQICQRCSQDFTESLPGSSTAQEKCLNCGFLSFADSLLECPSCGERVWQKACGEHSAKLYEGVCFDCLWSRNSEREREEAISIKQAEYEAVFQRANAAFSCADYSTAINLIGTLETEFDGRAAQMLVEAIELRRQRGKVLDTLKKGLEEGDVQKAVEESTKYKDSIVQKRIKDSEFLRLYRDCELRIEQAERAELRRRRFEMAINSAKVLVPLVGFLVAGILGLNHWNARAKAQRLGIALSTQSWDEALAISPDSVEALLGRAASRLEGNSPDFERVYADLNEAERINSPINTKALRGRASTLKVRNFAKELKLSEAEEELKRAKAFGVELFTLQNVQKGIGDGYLKIAEKALRDLNPPAVRDACEKARVHGVTLPKEISRLLGLAEKLQGEQEMAQGDVLGALACFDSAARIDPAINLAAARSRAHIKVAEKALKENDLVGAEKSLQLALSFDKGVLGGVEVAAALVEPAVSMLEKAPSVDTLELAVAALERSLDKSSDTYRGLVRRCLGSVSRAISNFELNPTQ